MGSYLLRMAGCCAYEKRNGDSIYSFAAHQEEDTSIDSSTQRLDIHSVQMQYADEHDERASSFEQVNKVIASPRRTYVHTRRYTTSALSKSVRSVDNEPRNVATGFVSDNQIEKSIYILKRKHFSIENTSPISEDDNQQSTSTNNRNVLASDTHVLSYATDLGHFENGYSRSRTENTSVEHVSTHIVEKDTVQQIISDNCKHTNIDVLNNSYLCDSRPDSSIIAKSKISESSFYNTTQGNTLVGLLRVSSKEPKGEGNYEPSACFLNMPLEQPETQQTNNYPHKVDLDGEVNETNDGDEHVDEDTSAYNADDECSINDNTFVKTNCYISKQHKGDSYRPESSSIHNLLQKQANSREYANNVITPGQSSYFPSEVKRIQRRRASIKSKRKGKEQAASTSDSSLEMSDCVTMLLPDKERKPSKTAPRK